MKLPAFFFYPGDWMKDPDLRRCSHAAKGVLIDLLCLMFECDQRGVLASRGKPWNDDETLLALGCNADVTRDALAELCYKGVLKRREDGALYSAKMIRDEQSRQKTKERVKKFRGNAACNGDVTLDVTPHVTPVAEDENEDPNKGSTKRLVKARAETMEEIIAYCAPLSLEPKDGEWFWLKMQGSGWKNDGKDVKCWKSTIRGWQIQGYFPSQKATKTSPTPYSGSGNGQISASDKEAKRFFKKIDNDIKKIQELEHEAHQRNLQNL